MINKYIDRNENPVINCNKLPYTDLQKILIDMQWRFFRHHAQQVAVSPFPSVCIKETHPLNLVSNNHNKEKELQLWTMK